MARLQILVSLCILQVACSSTCDEASESCTNEVSVKTDRYSDNVAATSVQAPNCGQLNMQTQVLDSILCPVSQEQFRSSYWSQRVLHVKRNVTNFFSSYLDVQEFSHILRHTIPPKGNGMNVVKEGMDVPIQPWNYEVILREMGNGATVVVNNVEYLMHSLETFTAQFEREGAHFGACNVYISPPKARGFGFHSDNHESFILQVQGEKVWTICEPEHRMPKRGDAPIFWNPDRPITTPCVNITMMEGDSLYVPKGYPHSPFTQEKSSVHITVSMDTDSYMWIKLLEMTSPPNFEKVLTTIRKIPEEWNLRFPFPGYLIGTNGNLKDPSVVPELETVLKGHKTRILELCDSPAHRLKCPSELRQHFNRHSIKDILALQKEMRCGGTVSLPINMTSQMLVSQIQRNSLIMRAPGSIVCIFDNEEGRFIVSNRIPVRDITRKQIDVMRNIEEGQVFPTQLVGKKLSKTLLLSGGFVVHTIDAGEINKPTKGKAK